MKVKALKCLSSSLLPASGDFETCPKYGSLPCFNNTPYPLFPGFPPPV